MLLEPSESGKSSESSSKSSSSDEESDNEDQNDENEGIGITTPEVEPLEVARPAIETEEDHFFSNEIKEF